MGSGHVTDIMKTKLTGRQKAIALILSGTFPGLGQLYNRQPLKGVLFLGAGAVLSWLVASAVPTDLLVLVEQGVSLAGVLALLVLLAVWTWSVIDAWRSAGR
jgi:TM2 domain-containing membrane protein YozV